MKRLTIFLISLLLADFLYGQRDSAVFVIEDAIRNSKNVKTIIYLDSSVQFYRSMRNLVKNGKLAGFKDSTKAFFELTKAEIKLLDLNFKKEKRRALKQNLFGNSLMITDDSLHKYFKTQEGYQYFTNTLGPKYFRFSWPVFFRNNTVAIFRLNVMWDPSSGNDLAYVYEKRNGEWQRLMVMYLGAW